MSTKKLLMNEAVAAVKEALEDWELLMGQDTEVTRMMEHAKTQAAKTWEAMQLCNCAKILSDAAMYALDGGKGLEDKLRKSIKGLEGQN